MKPTESSPNFQCLTRVKSSAKQQGTEEYGKNGHNIQCLKLFFTY